MLDTLLGELDLVGATLVGISKGGGIVLGYTLDSPARVRQLVLVDSFGLGDHVPGGRKAAVMIRTPKLLEASWWAMKKSRAVTEASLGNVVVPDNIDGEFVDDIRREIRRPNSGDAYFRFARAELRLSGPRTNYVERLSELPVETLFVHGKEDPLIPPELSKRAADEAPVADLFTLERVRPLGAAGVSRGVRLPTRSLAREKLIPTGEYSLRDGISRLRNRSDITVRRVEYVSRQRSTVSVNPGTERVDVLRPGILRNRPECRGWQFVSKRHSEPMYPDVISIVNVYTKI